VSHLTHAPAPAADVTPDEVARPPAFRHDPVKSVLTLRRGAAPAVRWATEPALCGYARLLHRSARTGAEVKVPVSASPVAVPGVGVVVGSYDGLVRLYDGTLAKVYWQIGLGAPIYASLLADRRRRRIVAVSTQGRVVCLSLRGELVWQSDTDAEIYATPTVVPAADLLVVAAFGSRCLGIDLATGRLRWARDLPRPWHADHGGSAAFREPYASPATTAAGTVVVACAEHVLCLEPDGTQRWRYEVGHSIRSSPAVLAGLGQVAVCAVDGGCVFLDADSGRLRGRVDLGGKVVASPAVAGDVLVVGTQDGTAFGIDGAQQTVAWSAPGRGPREYTSFSLLPDGHPVAVTARGNVVSLRRDDGRFRWETSQLLGLADHDPALDVTPVAAPDGSMYSGSYSGMLYRFRFRPSEEEQL
jgi:outer membrane protein assembly factor BamB